MTHIEESTASEQLKYMNNFLQKKGLSLKCTICNNTDFILEHPSGIENFEFDKNTKTNEYVPILIFTCKNCAHMITFSAEQTKFYNPLKS